MKQRPGESLNHIEHFPKKIVISSFQIKDKKSTSKALLVEIIIPDWSCWCQTPLSGSNRVVCGEDKLIILGCISIRLKKTVIDIFCKHSNSSETNSRLVWKYFFNFAVEQPLAVVDEHAHQVVVQHREGVGEQRPAFLGGLGLDLVDLPLLRRDEVGQLQGALGDGVALVAVAARTGNAICNNIALHSF